MNMKIEKPSQFIGRRNEELTIQRFQEFNLNVINTDDLKDNTKFHADVFEKTSGHLIELKTHRILNENESVLDSFAKVLSAGVERSKRDRNKQGLFYQLIKMNHFTDCSITILSIYHKEMNVMKNDFINNEPLALSNFYAYRVLVNQNGICSYLEILNFSFWALVRESQSVQELAQGLIALVDNTGDLEQSGQLEFIDFLTELNFGMSKDEIDQEIDLLNWNSQAVSIEAGNWLSNINHETELKKPDQQLSLNMNEQTSEKLTIDDLTAFKKEELVLIEQAIKDQKSYKDISFLLGHTEYYFQGLLTNANYAGQKWEQFRAWLKQVMIDQKYLDIPDEWCSDDHLTELAPKYKSENSSLKSQLSKQINKVKKLESQLEDMKMNDQNTTNEDIHNKIKAAYIAEIEKKDELLNERLAQIAKLEAQLHDLRHAGIQNFVASDINRDKRIIDQLLRTIDMLDEQE